MKSTKSEIVRMFTYLTFAYWNWLYMEPFDRKDLCPTMSSKILNETLDEESKRYAFLEPPQQCKPIFKLLRCFQEDLSTHNLRVPGKKPSKSGTDMQNTAPQRLQAHGRIIHIFPRQRIGVAFRSISFLILWKWWISQSLFRKKTWLYFVLV